MKASKSHPRIRVAAIILRGDTILLARHEKGGKAYWVLPGGGVDHGETLAEALVREVKEETNLHIRVGELVLVNDSIPPDQHRHIVNVVFRARIVRGRLRAGADGRLVGVRFVPVSDLGDLILYPDFRKELLTGIGNGFAAGARYFGNRWRDL